MPVSMSLSVSVVVDWSIWIGLIVVLKAFWVIDCWISVLVLITGIVVVAVFLRVLLAVVVVIQVLLTVGLVVVLIVLIIVHTNYRSRITVLSS
jgi:hypothetical protein